MKEKIRNLFCRGWHEVHLTWFAPFDEWTTSTHSHFLCVSEESHFLLPHGQRNHVLNGFGSRSQWWRFRFWMSLWGHSLTAELASLGLADSGILVNRLTRSQNKGMLSQPGSIRIILMANLVQYLRDHFCKLRPISWGPLNIITVGTSFQNLPLKGQPATFKAFWSGTQDCGWAWCQTDLPELLVQNRSTSEKRPVSESPVCIWKNGHHIQATWPQHYLPTVHHESSPHTEAKKSARSYTPPCWCTAQLLCCLLQSEWSGPNVSAQTYCPPVVQFSVLENLCASCFVTLTRDLLLYNPLNVHPNLHL